MCNHDINKVLSCNILFKYMYQQGIMGRTRKMTIQRLKQVQTLRTKRLTNIYKMVLNNYYYVDFLDMRNLEQQ